MLRRPYILACIALFPLAISTLLLYLNLSRLLRRELVSRERQIREVEMSHIVDTLRTRVDSAW
ncbi:MAG: hypothetical protein GX448_21440, partial [Planctomycetes bacterium]|nr:hypothetical protein [Planctomycetota bacterium]